MKTILIVDDDPDLRGAIEEFLRGRGFTTATAGTVDLARHIIATEQIDLLLSDVMMVPETGPELAEWVQKNHPGKFPIVFMSGMSEIPGYPFVAKPFSHVELLAVLNKAMGGQTDEV